MCQLCAMRGQNIHTDFIAEEASSGGEPPAAPVAFASIATLADYLINGYWAYADYQGTDPRSWASNTISVNMTDLTAAQQALAVQALNTWADVRDVTFTFTNGAANITYINDDTGDPGADAYCAQTVSGTDLTSATVVVTSSWGGGAAGGINGYYYQTLVHETGHALGLGHQGPYNNSADYNTDALWTNDSWRWSVMSYFDQEESDAGSYAYVLTPQMVDIYAVQQIYGATATRAGGTTYGFNSTAGSLYDFDEYASTPAFTIYDTGGTDTLNAQDYWQDQSIDLHGGSWSSIGGEENNIGIYTTTVIENAIGGSGDDQILGNDVANVLKGGGGADMIKGYGGADTLSGGGGDDQLEGLDGADQLYGDANNDTLIGGAGGDTLNGGTGIDTAEYVGSSAAVVVNLTAGTGAGGAAAGDTLTGIENLVGSSHADFLMGDAGVNRLEGRDGDDVLKGAGGADVLVGGNGADTASYHNSAAGVTVSLTTGTGENGEAEGDTLASIENLTGSGHDDVLVGNSGANVLSGGGAGDSLMGGSGADDLDGGAGADSLKGGGGADDLDGGTGIDTASYLGSAAGVTVSLFTDVASGGDAAGDELDNIENLIGSNHGDTLWGDDGANTLEGLGGADTLKGFGGADVLRGGSDDDTIVGGDGADTATFSATRAAYDVRTYLSGSTLVTRVDHTGTDGTDTIMTTEELQFTGGVSQLMGAQLNRASSIDGDRFDDVLFQNAGTGEVLYARMVDGVFQSWGSATSVLGSGWNAVASGNVNPSTTSGGAETFLQEASTGSILYASQDTGATTWGLVSDSLTTAWKLRAAADLNGDASVDVIVQDETTGAILYADMKGGTFQEWDVVNYDLTSDWIAVGAGDLNRDGFADVVVQQQSTGTTYYADMANGHFNGWGVVSTTLTADWMVKAVADVTGDGFADTIFQNSVGGGGINAGTTYFADVSTGSVQWGVVTTNVTGDWVVQGTADVDNDGFADVLMQNSAGGGGINPGTTYYADMGPSGFEDWGAVATTITAEWHVV